MTLYEALNGHLLQGTGWRLPPDSGDRADGRDSVPEEYLQAVDLKGYARRLSQRTLTLVTWVVMIAAAVVSGTNLFVGDWVTVSTMGALSLLCIPVLSVNRRYGEKAAGTLLSVVLLTAITVNLIESNGVRNIGIMTYPILLSIGGSILGKRSLIPLAGACGLSIGLVAALESTGRIQVADPVRWDGLVTIGVVLGAASFLVWISMDNSERHIDRIRRSEAKVRCAYERTLEAWSRALEYRDRETEGHSRRVTELTVRLAQELGLGEPELTRLRWGALLHDIGKLAIPDSILLKPGALTDEERELMCKHPVYARDMIAGIPFLRSVVDIPYHHHERWDGRGYPEGLEGHEIPLAARMFTIVDQWEALRSDRPYRRAWSRDEAVEYLKTNAGSIFDPHLVRVFLDRVAVEL